MPTQDSWGSLATRANDRVERWLQATPLDNSSAHDLIEGARSEAGGLGFARELLELVAASDDAFISALGLRRLSHDLPDGLSTRDRFALRAGSIAALGLPWAVIPLAKRWVRGRIAHLVCVATLPSDAKKTSDISGLQEALRASANPVLELDGSAVMGPRAAVKELARLRALAKMPEVEYLAVDPSRVAGGPTWDLDDRTERLAEILVDLAGDASVTLNVTRYEDLRAAVTAFLGALPNEQLDNAHVGITLPAETPESVELLNRVLVHAAKREHEGASPVEVRLTTASTVGAETITSIMNGLPVPVLGSRVERDAALLRLLAQAAGAPGVRPVIASDSPYLVAAALEISENIVVELRSGVSDELAHALRAHDVEVRTSLPLVSPDEFGAVVPRIVAIAAEAADSDSALNRQHMLDTEYLASPENRYDELATLEEVCSLASESTPGPFRTQDRGREWDPSERDSALFYRAPDHPDMRETGGLTAAVLSLNRNTDTGEIELATEPKAVPIISESGFANEPVTDPTRPENRQWFVRQLQYSEHLRQAQPAPAAPETTITNALAAAQSWTGSSHSARGRVLRRIALTSVAARDRLTAAFAATHGAPAETIDAAVNHVIDAGRYLAQLAESLEGVRGATFTPDRLALVAASDSTLSPIVLESALAALAAGSAVIITGPSSLAPLLTVVQEEWTAAGLPEGTLQFITGVEVGEISHDERVDRAITLGDRELATRVVQSRPDIRVESHFYGVGTALVTASADYEAAVEAIVQSAFTGAGTSLRGINAVLVTRRSDRFKSLLADAVRALRAGDTAIHSYDEEPSEEFFESFAGAIGASRVDGDVDVPTPPEETGRLAQDPLSLNVAPLPEPPGEAGLRALTELAPGEEWLVVPRKLDEDGLLWSPGVRLGVKRDATFWKDCVGMPVIGIVNVHSMHDAFAAQTVIGSGSTAALFSWDSAEIIPWLDRTKAASLTVNRPTTNALIERLPGGSWNGFGVAPLMGGPHQLVTLGSWKVRQGTQSSTLHLRGLEPEVQLLIELAQDSLGYEEFDRVRRAALADALTWRTQLGVARDSIGLSVEHNLLRYWPVSTHVRVAEDAALDELLRVLSAGLLVRSPIELSSGLGLPVSVLDFLQKQGIAVTVERDDDWLERIALTGPKVGSTTAERVRLIGGDRVRVAEWMGGLDRTALWAEPVTMAGPVELLTLLREQSVSIRAHRYGMGANMPDLAQWLREIGR